MAGIVSTEVSVNTGDDSKSSESSSASNKLIKNQQCCKNSFFVPALRS